MTMEMRTRVVFIGLVVASLVGIIGMYTWVEVTETPLVTSTHTNSIPIKSLACAGFYSSSEQFGINLPLAGTNYNALTYSTRLSVAHRDTTCNWVYGGRTFSLYGSIEVTVPVTGGLVYIQDFYGFGYKGNTNKDPDIYVWFKLNQTTMSSIASSAYIRMYYYKGEPYWELDLINGTMIGPIRLSPGQALRLDLFVKANATGTGKFVIELYAIRVE
ncbi:MAG: hypothetical protein QXG15_00140 [Desulfurococcaceae archaeon]